MEIVSNSFMGRKQANEKKKEYIVTVKDSAIMKRIEKPIRIFICKGAMK